LIGKLIITFFAVISKNNQGVNMDKNPANTNNWNNSDNAAYYENIPIETIRSFAAIGGFENGCDIDVIYNYIKDKKTIFDVGAGYGRALAKLIIKGYAGELYALERSESFYNYLQTNFADRVVIYKGDINTFAPKQKFDVILWLWSVVSDFPKGEQLAILKRLCDWLLPNGIFIMDTILHTVKLADDFAMDGQNYVETTNFGAVRGYLPSREEIANYAKQLGIKYLKQIDYITDTGRPRILHLLSNSPI
jgi:SAM-dependent methyltransferase